MTITIVIAIKLVISERNNAEVTIGLFNAFIRLLLLNALNNKIAIGSNMKLI